MTTANTTAHRSNIARSAGFDSLAKDWQETLVSDCVTPFEVERGKKILAREYKSAGKFPIIDQGQQLVAGYTDDESAVVRDGLPLIVFGDHTRIFKFVDFPFVIGADGTKLLKPRPNLDPKFLYFACLMLDIPSRGYNRHFKILREQSIRYPEFAEQRKIAAVLWKIQKAVEIEDAIVRNARDLKKSLLRRLFTHGLRGEPLKETEIGPLPESWNLQPLSEVRDFLQYGTSDRCELSVKGFPVLRIPNVVAGKVDTSEIKYADLAAKAADNLRLAHGDLLFVRTNGQREYVGRCAVYKGEPPNSLFASYLIRARLFTDRVNPDFMQAYTMTDAGKSFLSGRSHGAADGKFNINTQTINSALVPVPSRDEQDEIADTLQTVDRKIDIHESKKRSLQILFKTTLHKLMTAEIRVDDLDIDTSEMEMPTK
jgi:type I restriction enzyme, S subunit